MSKYQFRASQIAHQLGYGKEVVRKIENAKSDNEVTRILHSARDKAEVNLK